MYQDSFGNIVPASPGTLALGVYPPSIPSGAPQAPSSPPAQPNILMIMVDQLRATKWLPTGGQQAIDAICPNIAAIRTHSFNFPNHFAAATDCTPNRCSILTGLYSQQTAMFHTQTGMLPNEPYLQTAFPTFAAALTGLTSPYLPYVAYWMGKWHVSDFSPGGAYSGANGPIDYSFTKTPNLNFPPDKSTASPVGAANEGTEGWNQNNYNTNFPPTYPIYNPSGTDLGLTLPGKVADDAYIADQFLTAVPQFLTTQPWFACVSFVNPHDITHFPYNYGLTGATGPFAPPGGPIPPDSFYSPPIGGAGSLTGTPPQLEIYLPALQYPYTSVPTSAPWNFLDNPSDPALAYLGPLGTSPPGTGKPDLQSFFQTETDSLDGQVRGYVNQPNQTTSSMTGWVTFLNYYTWMQGCVDAEIGRVISALQVTSFWTNTVIIFTSDHGDYGGSHWLHMKGGALYDEAINIPPFCQLS